MKTTLHLPEKTFVKTVQPRSIHLTYGKTSRKKAIMGARHRSWFDKDAPQNLKVKEALFRAMQVVFLPAASGIDWVYGTSTMYILAPILFYLEVTALTLTCPIKELFHRYRNDHLTEL